MNVVENLAKLAQFFAKTIDKIASHLLQTDMRRVEEKLFDIRQLVNLKLP